MRIIKKYSLSLKTALMKNDLELYLICENVNKIIITQYYARMTSLNLTIFLINLVEIKQNIEFWCLWELIHIQNRILRRFLSIMFLGMMTLLFVLFAEQNLVRYYYWIACGKIGIFYQQFYHFDRNKYAILKNGLHGTA